MLQVYFLQLFYTWEKATVARYTDSYSEDPDSMMTEGRIVSFVIDPDSNVLSLLKSISPENP